MQQLHVATAVAFCLAIFFYTMAGILEATRQLSECALDADCSGSASTCHLGRCNCDQVFLHPVFRCDPELGPGINPFAILGLISLIAFICLCVTALALFDKRAA